MTRINSAILPSKLTDEHLLAEHREIKRICSVYSKLNLKSYFKIPKKFTLGTGHVLFFVDKPAFTYNRYLDIRDECYKRGFIVEDYSKNWRVYEHTTLKDYSPTEEEYQILFERIKERINTSKKKGWHYYKKIITKEEAINLLT
jgi:deoxyribonuclease (pyrimidine dimer)